MPFPGQLTAWAFEDVAGWKSSAWPCVAYEWLGWTCCMSSLHICRKCVCGGVPLGFRSVSYLTAEYWGFCFCCRWLHWLFIAVISILTPISHQGWKKGVPESVGAIVNSLQWKVVMKLHLKLSNVFSLPLPHFSLLQRVLLHLSTILFSVLLSSSSPLGLFSASFFFHSI